MVFSFSILLCSNDILLIPASEILSNTFINSTAFSSSSCFVLWQQNSDIYSLKQSFGVTFPPITNRDAHARVSTVVRIPASDAETGRSQNNLSGYSPASTNAWILSTTSWRSSGQVTPNHLLAVSRTSTVAVLSLISLSTISGMKNSLFRFSMFFGSLRNVLKNS